MTSEILGITESKVQSLKRKEIELQEIKLHDKKLYDKVKHNHTPKSIFTQQGHGSSEFGKDMEGDTFEPRPKKMYQKILKYLSIDTI